MSSTRSDPEDCPKDYAIVDEDWVDVPDLAFALATVTEINRQERQEAARKAAPWRAFWARKK